MCTISLYLFFLWKTYCNSLIYLLRTFRNQPLLCVLLISFPLSSFSFALLTHKKSFNKAQTLVQFIQNNLDEESKGNTHSHTLSREHEEQKSSLFKAEGKVTHLSHLLRVGHSARFFDPPLILFLALWMGGVFLTMDN